ncbi:MAG: hypothetical protein IPN15_05975 [Saprospiraceae bacterium]|nr:hypothetical protein [Candidatus Vicinibacter affinis]
MSKPWCIAALKEATAAIGKPKIINPDQGSQFTSAMWTQYLKSENILISMDGKEELQIIPGLRDSGSP